MNFVLTDGGKAEAGFTSEKNDCVVRSYAIVTGLEYKLAYRLLELHGRKQNKGVNLAGFINSERNFFPCLYFNGKKLKPATVRHFLEQHTTGKFIVAIRRHAFAVIDGTLHDTFKVSEKCVVKFYLEFI